jgi:RNA polymerase sigma-70 factor, ECF subfamily
MLEATLTPLEESTFHGLVERTYKKVFNLAYRLSGDRSDAEDLTQEAFFRAYRGFNGYEGDRPFENWIFRIVTRLFLDMTRSRKRRIQAQSYDAPIFSWAHEEPLQMQSADPGPNPEQVLLESQVSEPLQAALRQLKPAQRTLVLLADVEQMPYDEIAKTLEIPVGTVRSRLHRAHKKLRESLTPSPAAASSFFSFAAQPAF